ncbi:MAG: GntR family transcriptional regulator [Amaricoccus sp.]|uniref:GntR family transcriptional regulator n=1 Tax=Amaricoccus sp. TaxID=1872485 RepID=UPI0033159122
MQPSAEIARSLERAILEHRLPPGAKLSEDEVGEIFGAGRTVVRGALQSLAHRNLVTIKRNRGAFVARPDPREAREVFEARALLEPRTAHSAAGRATPAELRQLTAHIEAEHAALRSGDLGRAVYLSGLFHGAIAEIARQRTIAEFIAALVSRSSLIIALYWKRRDTLCESHAHHALMDAIAAGEGRLAEELMQSHLVDLLSGLDLTERRAAPRSLRDMFERSA